MVCRSETCDHEFCFIHQNQHTKEITCAHYEAKTRLEEKKNKAWESANTKKCPKCGVATEKNQGCNHMTCYVCKTGWCWLCGEEIGNQTMPDHYKEGKCKGKQFTTESVASYMTPMEASICVMVPFFFLMLFSPLAFVMVIVVCIISPFFFCCFCCFTEEESCLRCWEYTMNILIFGPMFLVTLPFWLPCAIYQQCVVLPRRQRMQEEQEEQARQLDARRAQQQEIIVGQGVAEDTQPIIGPNAV